MTTDASLIRVLFWLPLIFLVSYLAVGELFAFVVAFWPWIVGLIAVSVGLVLLAAKASQ